MNYLNPIPERRNEMKEQAEIDYTNKLYSLKLFEGFTTYWGTFIMRVPGGWIYDCWDIQNDNSKIGTFIPLNNEFQKITPE
jgi:hypothetical protein